MAEKNYAFIKDSNVVNIAIFDEFNTELISDFKNQLNLDEIILATNKTEIGGTYDGIRFWPIQPYPSWIKNEEINDWEAPMPIPEEISHKYIWNEEKTSWDLAPIPEKPFDSWIFDNQYHTWDPPIPYPNDGVSYTWNEQLLNWEEVSE